MKRTFFALVGVMTVSFCIGADPVFPPPPPPVVTITLRASLATVPGYKGLVFLLSVPDSVEAPCILQRSEDLKTWRSLYEFEKKVTRTIWYFPASQESTVFFRMLEL
jgi:hypothetical protein